MKENRYDDQDFFDEYAKMQRSVSGLAMAGEWDSMKLLLPKFDGKRLLDIGCGYGWHCIYAMEHGAEMAVGVDISQKMLEEARAKTTYPNVTYLCTAMEEMNFPSESFDIALSSLALHYTPDFEAVVQKVRSFLVPGGQFVFSVEHPVFTAQGSQQWHLDAQGNVMHFPVDNYFTEGPRNAVFLGKRVTKYHHTLTTFLGGLLMNGFELVNVVEPSPSLRLLDEPGMRDELRRPMMLLVSARKK